MRFYLTDEGWATLEAPLSRRHFLQDGHELIQRIPRRSFDVQRLFNTASNAMPYHQAGKLAAVQEHYPGVRLGVA